VDKRKMAVAKESIITEIQRTAAENDGVPLGLRAFERETGISASSWQGKYWLNWSDAVIAAGFPPNSRNEAHDRTFMLENLAKLTRKNGRFPTYADTRMEKNSNQSFPGIEAINRLGSLAERIELVRQYASENSEYSDVLGLLPEIDMHEDSPPSETDLPSDGYVYMGLLKMGRERRYKIGKTNLVERRKDQISVQLPEDLELIHAIRTDDASGIEAYWHRRFGAKRTKGEWFDLSRQDVTTFKRRKFM
jgi:hypothetical protein